MLKRKIGGMTMKNFNKLTITVLALLFGITAENMTAAQTNKNPFPFVSYCTGDNVNVRDLDGSFKDWDVSVEKTGSYKKYKVFGHLMKGDVVKVSEVKGEWASISNENVSGWVAKKYFEGISGKRDNYGLALLSSETNGNYVKMKYVALSNVSSNKKTPNTMFEIKVITNIKVKPVKTPKALDEFKKYKSVWENIRYNGYDEKEQKLKSFVLTNRLYSFIELKDRSIIKDEKGYKIFIGNKVKLIEPENTNYEALSFKSGVKNVYLRRSRNWKYLSLIEKIKGKEYQYSLYDSYGNKIYSSKKGGYYLYRDGSSIDFVWNENNQLMAALQKPLL